MRIRLTATRILALGFLALILIGAALLSLPVAARDGEGLAFADALFTSTSAVCVTGLTVLETGRDFSLAGQIIILCLIQIGGLGFVTIITLLFIIVGRKITIRDRLLIQEAMNENNIGGMVRLILWVLKMTAVCELAGAILLSTRFIPAFGWAKGIYYSIFHSISAFCNAGFDVLGDGTSVTRFSADPVVLLTLSALVIIGGLGFGVIHDITGMKKRKRLRVHTKLALSVAAALLISGALFVLLAEWSNPDTLGGMPFPRKLLAAFFESTTFRTAGFAALDQALLKPATKFFGAVFMFIGASPASTGGGIKTTTVAALLLMIICTVRGRDEISAFGRAIPRDIIRRASAILFIGVALLTLDAVAISLMQPEMAFIDVFFECASALGTVGLSSAGTSNFSASARILIMITMYVGRIGPLGLTLAIARRQALGGDAPKRPDERIIVG